MPMRPPALACHDRRLVVCPARVARVDARVEQPEDEDEAGYGPQNNPHYLARSQAVVERPVCGRDS